MRETIDKRIIHIIVIYFILAGGSSLWPQAYKKFEYLSREQGLSQCTPTCMIQDRRGFLWIGTGDGLNMYDGYDFKVFYHEPGNPNSLSSSGIGALCEDRWGNIWIGTRAGGVCRMDPATQTFSHFLPNERILAIIESSSGVLWTGSPGVLRKFDPATETSTFYQLNVIVNKIYEDTDGALWLGGRESGLIRFDPADGSTERFVKDPGKPGSIPDNDISGICPAPDGGLMIGTMGGGLAHFDKREKVFTQRFRGSGNLALGGSKYVSAIAPSRARPGILWAATFGGLLEFDMTDMRIVDFQVTSSRSDSLNSNDLVSVLEDREGILWVGSYSKGLNKFVGKKSVFQSYRHHPCDDSTIGNDTVFAILEDSNGFIWVGTEAGGLDMIDPATSTVKHFKYSPDNPNGLNSNFVRVIREDKDGNIWVGTNGNGLNRLDPKTGQFSHFVHHPEGENSLKSRFIRDICVDRTGVIWVAKFAEGLDAYDPKTGVFSHYRHRDDDPSSLSGDLVQCVFEDLSGVIWVGTATRGLNRLDRKKGTFTHYLNFVHDLDTNAAPASIMALYQDSRGIFWVGTHGNGLLKFDPETGSFIGITTQEGLPNNVVYGILEDRSGNLWLSTNCGLARFNPMSGVVQTFDRSDGLGCVEFNMNACCLGASGEMFFGGINGMVSFYPQDIEKSLFVPPVQFTGFKVLNRKYELQNRISDVERLKLSHKDTFILEFSALSYSSPTKNQYAYKLSELHDDWIPLGNQRVITFAYMEPGDYVLRVKGSNADGVWNEEGAAIRLVIEPPVWQTWWFKVLMVLLAGALAYYWHTVKLKNATLKLKTESALHRLFINFKLSEREQEIASLIMKGNSNKDIEDKLFISINTVKSHIYSIYRKMGVKSRLEMINLVQKMIRE